MRKRRPVAIVVDASVARASDEPAATGPKARACGAALQAIQQTPTLRLAWSPDLRWEWLEKPVDKPRPRLGHASLFARLFLREMQQRRRVVHLDPPRAETIRETAWRKLAERDYRAVEKDMHLIEAALASDHRVLSLDDAMRTLLGRLDARELRRLSWASPAADGCVRWLEDGAPAASRWFVKRVRE